MDPQTPTGMSRRERQIMDIVYRRGQVTAAEVLDELPDPRCA
ncbi:MAG TPA: BlaI/MecI/CopY family transcriptional regulator [Longimicrobium sp.]|jgi:predicted transcriptional regulator